MEAWLSGEAARLYVKNPIKFPESVYEFVMKHLKDKRKKHEADKFDLLLDAGCGNGEALRRYLPHFQSAVGFDISEEQIRIAKRMTNSTKVTYFVGQEGDMPVKDNSVDLLCCVGSVHYMDIKKFVVECRRVLKEDGMVALYCSTVTGINIQRHSTSENININDALSGDDILTEHFLEPLKQYHLETNHPYLECENRYRRLFEKIDGMEKFQPKDLTIENNISLYDLKEYFLSMPTFKNFLDLFGADSTPLDHMGEKLKNLINKSGISDKELKLTMKTRISFIFLFK